MNSDLKGLNEPQDNTKEQVKTFEASHTKYVNPPLTETDIVMVWKAVVRGRSPYSMTSIKKQGRLKFAGLYQSNCEE